MTHPLFRTHCPEYSEFISMVPTKNNTTALETFHTVNKTYGTGEGVGDSKELVDKTITRLVGLVRPGYEHHAKELLNIMLERKTAR